MTDQKDKKIINILNSDIKEGNYEKFKLPEMVGGMSLSSKNEQKKTFTVEKKQTLSSLTPEKIEMFKKSIEGFKIINEDKSKEKEIFEIDFQDSFSIYKCMRNFDYTPTAIQSATLKLASEGEDLIVKAPTGMGKTFCYLIPIIEKIKKDEKALIIAPTRELALQIENEAKILLGERRASSNNKKFGFDNQRYKTRNIKVGAIIGKTQLLNSYDNCNIIVVTVGRVIDCLEKKIIDLNNLRHLILDESDKLLEVGFDTQILQILGFIPNENMANIQKMLFSATFNPKVDAMIASIFRSSRKYYLIEYKDELQSNIKQSFVFFNEDSNSSYISTEKMNYLLNFLGECNFAISWSALLAENAPETTKMIIFVETKRDCEEIYNRIQRAARSPISGYSNKEGASIIKDVAVERLHGDKDQIHRTSIMAKFKKDVINVLVATSVASRGIDVDNITHVINFTPPSSYKEYVHRIGRTGRQGKKGEAITYLVRSGDAIVDLQRDSLVSLVDGLKESENKIPEELTIALKKGKAGYVSSKKGDNRFDNKDKGRRQFTSSSSSNLSSSWGDRKFQKSSSFKSSQYHGGNKNYSKYKSEESELSSTFANKKQNPSINEDPIEEFEEKSHSSEEEIADTWED